METQAKCHACGAPVEEWSEPSEDAEGNPSEVKLIQYRPIEWENMMEKLEAIKDLQTGGGPASRFANEIVDLCIKVVLTSAIKTEEIGN